MIYFRIGISISTILKYELCLYILYLYIKQKTCLTLHLGAKHIVINFISQNI